MWFADSSGGVPMRSMTLDTIEKAKKRPLVSRAQSAGCVRTAPSRTVLNTKDIEGASPEPRRHLAQWKRTETLSLDTVDKPKQLHKTYTRPISAEYSKHTPVEGMRTTSITIKNGRTARETNPLEPTYVLPSSGTALAKQRAQMLSAQDPNKNVETEAKKKHQQTSLSIGQATHKPHGNERSIAALKGGAGSSTEPRPCGKKVFVRPSSAPMTSAAGEAAPPGMHKPPPAPLAVQRAFSSETVAERMTSSGSGSGSSGVTSPQEPQVSTQLKGDSTKVYRNVRADGEFKRHSKVNNLLQDPPTPGSPEHQANHEERQDHARKGKEGTNTSIRRAQAAVLQNNLGSMIDVVQGQGQRDAEAWKKSYNAGRQSLLHDLKTQQDEYEMKQVMAQAVRCGLLDAADSPANRHLRSPVKTSTSKQQQQQQQQETQHGGSSSDASIARFHQKEELLQRKKERPHYELETTDVSGSQSYAQYCQMMAYPELDATRHTNPLDPEYQALGSTASSRHDEKLLLSQQQCNEVGTDDLPPAAGGLNLAAELNSSAAYSPANLGPFEQGIRSGMRRWVSHRNTSLNNSTAGIEGAAPVSGYLKNAPMSKERLAEHIAQAEKDAADSSKHFSINNMLLLGETAPGSATDTSKPAGAKVCGKRHITGVAAARNHGSPIDHHVNGGVVDDEHTQELARRMPLQAANASAIGNSTACPKQPHAEIFTVYNAANGAKLPFSANKSESQSRYHQPARKFVSSSSSSKKAAIDATVEAENTAKIGVHARLSFTSASKCEHYGPGFSSSVPCSGVENDESTFVPINNNTAGSVHGRITNPVLPDYDLNAYHRSVKVGPFSNGKSRETSLRKTLHSGGQDPLDGALRGTVEKPLQSSAKFDASYAKAKNTGSAQRFKDEVSAVRNLPDYK